MIRDYFRVERKNGQFGFELEVEAENPQHLDALLGFCRDNNKVWRVERDGSLRNHAAELVFREPMDLINVYDELRKMSTFIDNNNLEFPDTGRAGVHVHVNMQQYTMKQVFNVVCLYLILEEACLEMCGDWRVGNLFCLGAKHAEGMIEHIVDVVRTQEWRDLKTDEIRYAALNMNSLTRYGSLEFRAMRSTTDYILLTDWITVLRNIVTVATQYDSPEDIINEFSMKGPRYLYDSVFGNLEERPAFDPDAMLEGMVLAQQIAFATDWSKVVDPEGIDWDMHVARATAAIALARDMGKPDNGFVQWLDQAVHNINSGRRLPPNYGDKIDAYITALYDFLDGENEEDENEDDIFGAEPPEEEVLEEIQPAGEERREPF